MWQTCAQQSCNNLLTLIFQRAAARSIFSGLREGVIAAWDSHYKSFFNLCLPVMWQFILTSSVANMCLKVILQLMLTRSVKNLCLPVMQQLMVYYPTLLTSHVAIFFTSHVESCVYQFCSKLVSTSHGAIYGYQSCATQAYHSFGNLCYQFCSTIEFTSHMGTFA